jgi:hypothetical protein
VTLGEVLGANAVVVRLDRTVSAVDSMARTSGVPARQSRIVRVPGVTPDWECLPLLEGIYLRMDCKHLFHERPSEM